MLLSNNTKRARYNEDGELIRAKIEGFLPISIGYGRLLFLEQLDDKLPKAYFLLPGFVKATGESFSPALIRKMPNYAAVSDDLMPHSKKFALSEELAAQCNVGSEYWFTYSSTPVTKNIKGRDTTYEDLALIDLADTTVQGLKSIIESLKIQFSPAANS